MKLRKSWIVALSVLVLALAACGGHKASRAATPTTVATHMITGVFSLHGSAAADTEIEDQTAPNENFTTDKDLGLDGNGCLGRGGYSDVAAGLQVNVSDESGAIIATGALEQGEVVPDQFWNNCNFPFTVSSVPTAKFYRVEVGHRGQVTYSYDQMQAAGWRVALSLG
jgi:hypothetical protein